MTYLPKTVPNGFSEILNEELHKHCDYSGAGLPKSIPIAFPPSINNGVTTIYPSETNHHMGFLFPHEYNITKSAYNPNELFPISIVCDETHNIEITNHDDLREYLEREDKPLIVLGHWRHNKDYTIDFVPKEIIGSNNTIGEMLNIVI